MSTYRAACWISADRQAEVRLTTEEHSHLPDDELLKVAQRFIDETGLVVGDGSIVIGDFTE